MGKKQKKKKSKKINYGTAEFYCRHCDYRFEMDWEAIWEIQECTHGSVGYHLYDTFIGCPKCNEVCRDEEIPEVNNQVNIRFNDDLPF